MSALIIHLDKSDPTRLSFKDVQHAHYGLYHNLMEKHYNLRPCWHANDDDCTEEALNTSRDYCKLGEMKRRQPAVVHSSETQSLFVPNDKSSADGHYTQQTSSNNQQEDRNHEQCYNRSSDNVECVVGTFASSLHLLSFNDEDEEDSNYSEEEEEEQQQPTLEVEWASFTNDDCSTVDSLEQAYNNATDDDEDSNEDYYLLGMSIRPPSVDEDSLQDNHDTAAASSSESWEDENGKQMAKEENDVDNNSNNAPSLLTADLKKGKGLDVAAVVRSPLLVKEPTLMIEPYPVNPFVMQNLDSTYFLDDDSESAIDANSDAESYISGQFDVCSLDYYS